MIICKDWAETKDKAKSLEHIIQKCDLPTPAMPLVTTGTAVPELYSHIAHSVDKDEAEIPPLFKGAKPKQTRGRGKPKGKPQGHSQNPPKDQEADESVEVMVMVLNKQEDVVVVGPITTMIIITSISITLMISRPNSMANPVAYVEVLIIPPKYCYKGEHDINNIMEKMSINPHQQQQGNLYQ